MLDLKGGIQDFLNGCVMCTHLNLATSAHVKGIDGAMSNSKRVMALVVQVVAFLKDIGKNIICSL